MITVSPYEQGTAIVTIDPQDEDGNSLTISQLTNPQWQLMRVDGTIINDRSFANSSVTDLSWVLSGDDLAIFSMSDTGERVLSFKATYNSTIGLNLPLIGECEFTVTKVLGQTNIDEA